MKTVIAASALLSIAATSGFACSSDERAALSNSIQAAVEQVVAQDSANLGAVMNIMQTAATSEYHAGPLAPSCARQSAILGALTEFSDALNAEKSAMLQKDVI